MENRERKPMLAFLQETFRHFSGSFRTWNQTPSSNHSVQRAVEHVVDETFTNIRALSGYAKRLHAPVANAFIYIDELVERIPEPFQCSRSTFNHEPKVNSFFAGPDHVQEVFSNSEEVRRFFENDPEIEECCVLLCMHKHERRQLGMALDGDILQRDIMQTTVNFSEHQLVSPGRTEAEARQVLKCCIFNSLLDTVRQRARLSKQQTLELEIRLQRVRKQIQQTTLPAQQFEWQRQLAEIEGDLLGIEPRLVTLEDYLNFLTHVFDEPQLHIRGRQYPLHLTRLGVKLEPQQGHSASHQLLLSEIQIGAKQPRIAALVRFPRHDLLPQQNFLKKADLFLSIL
jgi:hypothetical protein